MPYQYWTVSLTRYYHMLRKIGVLEHNHALEAY